MDFLLDDCISSFATQYQFMPLGLTDGLFLGEYAKFDKSSDDLSKQQTAKVHCGSKPAMKW